MTKKKIGRFIVFEGIDGSGKSTQMVRIANRLKRKGENVYTTVEPTDGPIGSLIRQMLSGQLETDQRTIASLFAADRMEHLVNPENGIRSKVDRGKFVLCDRYYFSSYAYHAQHIDLEWVIHANSLNAEILRPDVTIFIDVEPATCFERIKTNRADFEIYEKLDIMEAVRTNYLKAFEHQKGFENVIIVDGNKSMETVEKAIWNEIRKFM